MFGFHLFDLLIIAFFFGIAALITGLVLWAVLRPAKVVYVPVYVPTLPTQQPYQGPGQPGAQPQDAGE